MNLFHFDFIRSLEAEIAGVELESVFVYFTSFCRQSNRALFESFLIFFFCTAIFLFIILLELLLLRFLLEEPLIFSLFLTQKLNFSARSSINHSILSLFFMKISYCDYCDYFVYFDKLSLVGDIHIS